MGITMRISLETDFRDHVADRQIVDREGNWYIAYSNGSLAGESGGLKLSARWNWKDSFWCRAGTLGKQKVSDCWALNLQGDSLKMKPAAGGRTITYRIR